MSNTLLDSKGKAVKMPRPPRSLARPEHVRRYLGSIARMVHSGQLSASKAVAMASCCKAILSDMRLMEQRGIDVGAEPITEINVIISNEAVAEEIRKTNENILPAPDEDESEDIPWWESIPEKGENMDCER